MTGHSATALRIDAGVHGPIGIGEQDLLRASSLQNLAERIARSGALVRQHRCSADGLTTLSALCWLWLPRTPAACHPWFAEVPRKPWQAARRWLLRAVV